MKKLILAASLIFAFNPANAAAASSEQVKVFLQTVGCSQLPTGVCEALSATNARNILKTYQSRLSLAYCGSGNFNQAKQLLELNAVPDKVKCKKLIAAIK